MCRKVHEDSGHKEAILEEHLVGKIRGLDKKNCFSKHSSEKKKDGGSYTGSAEILQTCDLLTSSARGLCCSLFGEETSESWDKNTLRKNIHYYIPDIKEKLSSNKNIYFPKYQPYEEQTFVIYKWRGGVKRQNAPILRRM